MKSTIAGALVAKEVIVAESQALADFAAALDLELFDRILDAIVERCDRVIVSGLGKSGNIAQKIAASLTSTGTPAHYLHPVEALHGDLGIVTERHALVALSRSGNTEEVVRFVTHFRRLGGPVIGITQGAQSRLVELSDFVIQLPDCQEAGPLQLAPTTSCILQLAAGDALAMALLQRRGFAREDFATYHPDGPLGRRLLLRAADVMHAGQELPLCPTSAGFDALILEMTRKQLGLALLVDEHGKLVGTFTDGDLRRIFARVENPHVLDAGAAHARSRRDPAAPAVPISAVDPQTLAVDCLRTMRDSQITALVVADAAGKPVGLVRLMDLVRAGLS